MAWIIISILIIILLSVMIYNQKDFIYKDDLSKQFLLENSKQVKNEAISEKIIELNLKNDITVEFDLDDDHLRLSKEPKIYIYYKNVLVRTETLDFVDILEMADRYNEFMNNLGEPIPDSSSEGW